MLAVGRPNESQDGVKEISLTDIEIEHSEALVALLDMFYGVPLPLPSLVYLDSSRRAKINLEMTIQLARKYDCSGALETLHHAVRGWVSFGGGDCNLVFVLAAAFDDIEACSMLIKRHGMEHWEEDGEGFDPDIPLLMAIPGYVFEMATWPIDLAERVPFRYMFARNVFVSSS